MCEQEKDQTKEQRVRRLAAQLYAEHHLFLVRIARRNSFTLAEAEEAVQEALASFIAHYDPAGGAPPKAWLTLTLKRQCWRQARDAHIDRWVSGDTEAETEEPRWLLERIPAGGGGTERRFVEVDEARRRLAPLSADQRDALGLHATGLNYEEIAAVRKWTRTKTDRCLRRGRARLRSQQG